jgi:signal transduction histidine kinase/CheY-like chemotaxis protein/ligand-binding sensor domain-containing protein
MPTRRVRYLNIVCPILAAVGLLLAAPLRADDGWTPVRAFRLFPRSLWHGLPQSTVRLITQDTNGILWIGTFDGLASFDGHELTPVAPAPNAPVQGFLTAMTARGRGGLAVSSPAGVHLSDGEHWRVVPSTRAVVALTEDRDGTLWMADGGGAVFTLGDNDEWQAHPEVQESALALAAAGDGSVWAATATGALRLDHGTAAKIEAPGLRGPPSAILVARDGRVWLATYAATLQWTRAGDTTWHEVSLKDWPGVDQLRGLAEDRRGRIWAGTINGYVAFGNPETGFTTWGPENAPVGGIQTIFADREGSLWFGMNRAGLAQWVGEAWSHRVSFLDGGMPGDRMAMAGVTRGKGNHSLLVAGYAVGVLRLEDDKPPRIWADGQGLTEHARQAVEPEPGTLWVAARFGVMESRGGEKLRYTLKLKAGFANGLFESPTGRWYAATSTEGVFVREGGVWRSVPEINRNLDALHVRGIAWTKEGEMWVETLRGVSVFRNEKDAKLVEKISDTQEPSFPQSVNAVVEAANGDIWVGGIGGIAVRSGSSWRSLPMKNGPGATIYSMAKAPDGSIWAGGANGVGRFAGGSWTTWDSRSGLLDDECNLNGLFIGDDGSVYVGTMGGLARFDPTVGPLAPPPLKLRWLRTPPVGADGTVQLLARDLQLRWSAAWLGPHPVEYRVRMPGLKDSWSEPTPNGSLDVQNLGPGPHRVEVEARVDGVLPWTEPLKLSVAVRPRWHETLSARAAMAGLLALIGAGLVRLRVGQLRRHAAALESTVRARTGDLAEKVALLEESERRAQAASRAKTTFLANTSHELRTPLNAVLGFAQLMARRPARDPEDQRHLAVILRSGEHLLGLINDVLSMARIEAGGASLNESAFSPAALVASVEQILRPKSDAKGLGFRVELAPGIPQRVSGDAGKLRQILLNLVGNAIKFTEKGEVVVRASWNAGRASFEVRDTGPGIAPSEMGGLFEPFVQAQAGRGAHEGTGLGLALSQNIARLMGGGIRAHSDVGRGSTFVCEVSLPLATESATTAEPSSRARVVRLAPGQQTFRVLVVDDVADNRDALAGLLRAVGFEVRTAESGEETLTIFREWRPHLIWMDKGMPGLDGLETTRRIRAEASAAGAPTKIIVLSASALDHERSGILESGCDDFLAKPYREEVVFAKTAEQLGARFVYEPEEGDASTSDARVERSFEGSTAMPPSALKAIRRLQALVSNGDLAALNFLAEFQEAIGPAHVDTAREIERRLKLMELDSTLPLLDELCASFTGTETDGARERTRE